MLIAIIIGLFIVIYIISKIYGAIGGTIGRAKVAMQAGSNPEAALQTIIRNRELATFSVEEYATKLKELAENTGYAKAMVKLSELYDGNEYSQKKDVAKAKIWRRKAAEAGDLESIIKIFGFSSFDVSDDAYDDMLRLLNNAKPADDKEAAVRNYALGVVHYKRGNITDAKKQFGPTANVSSESKFMLANCFEKEGNYAEAERLLLEMADNAWKGYIHAHKKLWSYYITGNKDVAPDYWKSFEYAKKYFESEGMDEATAREMMGKSCINMAHDLQEGNHGFEINIEKARELYEAAVAFGNQEALLPLGLMLWTGETDGVCIIRDYYKANEYLYKAMQNGDSQAKEYLEKYGVDGIIVAPLNQKDATYKLSGGFELTATAKTLTSVQLYIGTRYKANLTADTFADDYAKQFNSFKELMDGVFTLYGESVAIMIQWCINLLMSMGIDHYDAGEIVNQCDDLGLLDRIPSFERGLDAIDNRAAQLNMDLAYVQATRRGWVGGGIGTTIGGTIGASIRGSVAAGALNVGSGILHGVGDSIVKGMNNAEINGMTKKLFDNPNTKIEFQNAVISACNEIGDVIMRIIEENGNVGLERLVGDVAYNGEHLEGLTDNALDAKINNNLSAGNLEYSNALLIEKLRRLPRSGSVLNQLYKLTGQLTVTQMAGIDGATILERYGGDFGLAISK